ncbi:hypothetical protein Q8F55_008287 [Vanrija albida]|uniref:Uncharacterized protein n=1 Tax=Vanrija albida TaxID=181172 RepID=A0ABR3PVU2_9TREE
MLCFTAIVLSLATLGAAQSSSATPPTQTSPTPTAPSGSAAPYTGPQASPGFGFVYPKNGSYFPLQPTKEQLPKDAPTGAKLYPWQEVGQWLAYIKLPKEKLNETMAINVYHINGTSASQNYLGRYMTPATSYAVSELFEFRETDKLDPSVPGGPNGSQNSAAGSLLPPISLVFLLSGAIGVWSLV